jgi:CRISPR-associated protein (TIGR03984 family)
MTSLYYSQHDGLSCVDALAVAERELGACQVLISTPSTFTVARLSTSGLDAHVANTCFSFRAFSNKGELRWELSDGKVGSAILVSLAKPNSNGAFDEILSSGVITQKYLCWGEVVSVRDGWATLNSGRTSNFEVPVEASIGDFLYMKTTEYLAVAKDIDGNAFVVDELINGFFVENVSNHEQ